MTLVAIDPSCRFTRVVLRGLEAAAEHPDMTEELADLFFDADCRGRAPEDPRRSKGIDHGHPGRRHPARHRERQDRGPIVTPPSGGLVARPWSVATPEERGHELDPLDHAGEFTGLNHGRFAGAF